MTTDINLNLNYIRFDVGHYLYTCHRNTILASGHESILSKLISPEFDKRKSNLDYIIIDRDGKHFGTILNYLRDSSSLNLDILSDNELEELSREADYYCLVDLLGKCQFQIDERLLKQLQSIDINDKPYIVPENQKLEIIYGCDTMLQLMATAKRRVIVLSYKSMKRFHIDSWFEELMRMHCDFSKNVVYCYSGETQHRSFVDFILFFYNPKDFKITYRLKAPEDAKFKSRRKRYKTKIYKYWFMNQVEQPI